MKLTEPQRRLLVDLESGPQYAVDFHPPRIKLIKLGLAKVHEKNSGWIAITDAGREWLNENQ